MFDDDSQDRNSLAQSIFWRNLGWEDGTLQEEMIATRLRQRAEQYAKPTPTDDDTPTITSVIFRLGDETYGVDALVVHAVRRIGKIAMVPNIPDFYAGVVNLRGQIITVMDLRRFFGASISETAPPEELLVIRAHGLELGILAHAIHDVLTFKMSDIQPLSDMGYAWGISPQKVILLDIARLFTDDR
ncbi:MAG: chemotaxis protein CheW, partial [bacterium]|nr:chemotaxis protein CheW [bacterium]